MEDQLIWNLDPNGAFSIKRTWNSIRSQNYPVNWTKFVCLARNFLRNILLLILTFSRRKYLSLAVVFPALITDWRIVIMSLFLTIWLFGFEKTLVIIFGDMLILLFVFALPIYWHLRRLSSLFPIFRRLVLAIIWNIWKERWALKLGDSSCNIVECIFYIKDWYRLQIASSKYSQSHPLLDLESRLFSMFYNLLLGH